jgi:hypothetical protein
VVLVINEPVVRRMAASVCLGLLVGGFGCASLAAQRARTESLERQLDAFRYTEPLDDVWQHARLLLAERGYPLAGADAKAAGQPTMSVPVRIFSPARETSTRKRGSAALIDNTTHVDEVVPQSLDTGWNTYWKRYHVEASVAADGCRVIFTRLEQEQTDRQVVASRDLELELELLRRIDPVRAARIEAKLASHEH